MSLLVISCHWVLGARGEWQVTHFAAETAKTTEILAAIMYKKRVNSERTMATGDRRLRTGDGKVMTDDRKLTTEDRCSMLDTRRS